MAAPVVAPVVQQPPANNANIRYVDQHGNPVSPPQTQGATTMTTVVQPGYPGTSQAGAQQNSPEQMIKGRKTWYRLLV